LSGSVRLDVHGLTISITGWAEVVESVRLDYAWFASDDDTPARVQVEALQGAPDLDAFAATTASYLTPQGAVYRTATETIVDHHSRAVSIIDASGDRLRLQGIDDQAVHDAAYYFVLGRIGEHLDRRGLVRLHGLGLAGAQGGVAVLLPVGGGKTTLALQALRLGRAQLLSEDSPLLDRGGRLYPFPLRIAVRTHEPPPDSRRLVRGKVAVEVESFADRIAADPTPLHHLVVGRSSLGRAPRLEPRSKRAAILPLLREGAVGVGVYQGLGYAHQRGAREFSAKLAVAARRAAICAAALRGAAVWELALGRDPEQSWAALERLLK
jgi:hypothetical protein